MPYRVDLPACRLDAIERLIDLGAIDVEPTADGIAALMPDHVTPEQIADAAGANAVVSPATARDAESVWILSPRPIRIGRLTLVPAGADTGPDAVALVDSAAFGTGHHPTTALCLELLDAMLAPPRPEQLLDVGTGSGVLALAALRLGVPRALGIDVDDEALRVAAANARLNALSDRLTLERGGPEIVSGTWPLVLANVLAAPLIEMAPALVRRVGHRGSLILSGIPTGVERDVDRAYRRLGMRHVRTLSRGGWAAMVLQASW